MKKIKFLATVGLAVIELGAFSVFGGIDCWAAVPDSYEYVAKLNISSKGWRTYSTGSCRDMVGNSNGEVKNASKVYVMNSSLNSKGNMVSEVYSPDLEKICFISTKYLERITTEEPIDDTVGDENTTIADVEYHETVSKIVEGYYVIRPKVNEESCLDLKDWSTESGTNCQIWTSHGGANQIFRVTKNDEGYWRIQSMHSGKFLTASEMNTHYSVANAVFADEDDTENQQFEIKYDTKNESFQIINRGNGLSLYVALGKNDDGTNVCMIPELNGDISTAQRFEFCSVFLNNEEIYVNQNASRSCTRASAIMMLRKKLELRGQDFKSCTESNLAKICWGSKGLKNNFSYLDMNITCKNIQSMNDEEKKAYLIKMLQEHPEGIVIYDKYNIPAGKNEHAVYLADYDAINDSFKIYDPSSGIANNLIDLNDCSFKDNTGSKLHAIDIIWYIKN